MIRSRQKALAVDPLEFLPCVPKLGGTRTFGSAESVQDNGDGYFPLGLGSFGGCRENCIKLKVHLTFKPPSTSLPFAFLPYHSPNQRVVNLDPFTFPIDLHGYCKCCSTHAFPRICLSCPLCRRWQQDCLGIHHPPRPCQRLHIPSDLPSRW